jgi:hypothetical protein
LRLFLAISAGLSYAKPVEAKLKSVYVETTIPSYATARTSQDIILAGRQALTHIFWEQERCKYILFVSQDVIDECNLGDPDAAQKRLDFISGIPLLPITPEVDTLAAVYQKLLDIPDRAKTDCSHLAICVIEKIDFLLSWNCAHLGVQANSKIRDYNEKHHLWTPLLVTPEALSDLGPLDYTMEAL